MSKTDRLNVKVGARGRAVPEWAARIVRYWRQLFNIKFRLIPNAVYATKRGVAVTIGDQSVTLAWEMTGEDQVSIDARGEFLKRVEGLVEP